MSIKITGTFGPAGLGGFPLVVDDDLKGGWRTVDDTTARDAISSFNRKEGMRVYSIADAVEFQLVGGITNADWQVVESGGGSPISLATAKEGSFLVTDSLAPDMRIPIATVSDGYSVWGLKCNYTVFSSSGPGVVRIDPVTNKFIESIDIGLGDPGNFTDIFDIATCIVWTGTQLFTFGFNGSDNTMWSREVLISSTPTTIASTFGPRLTYSGEIPIQAAWDSVNNKIWVLGEFTGTIYRFDPATLPTAEVTLTPGGGFVGFGMVFDPIAAAYPDNKPRLYVSDPAGGTGITRYKDLDTLSPISDANVSSDSTFITTTDLFLFGGYVSTLEKFVKQPFALSTTGSGPELPLGLIFDPISSNGIVSSLDTVTANPQITQIDINLNTLSGPLDLSTTSIGAFTFIPYSMCMQDGYVWVPVESQQESTRGNIFRVDPVLLAPAMSFRDLGLIFDESYGRVQFILDVGGFAIWDGYADTIVVVINNVLLTPTTTTIAFGPAREFGKTVTVIDGLGNVNALNTISIIAIDTNTLPSYIATPICAPISKAHGSVTVSCGFKGNWTVKGNNLSSVLQSGNTTDGQNIILTNNSHIGSTFDTGVTIVTDTVPSSSPGSAFGTNILAGASYGDFDGAPITLAGGDLTNGTALVDGVGAIITIGGGQAGGTNYPYSTPAVMGGNINLSGGSIAIIDGSSGLPANPGVINIDGAYAGSAPDGGGGGVISITAGDGYYAGGEVNITSGSASGNGYPVDIGHVGAFAGNINIIAGNGTSSTVGNGTHASYGGGINIKGGNNTQSGGGDIVLAAGDGYGIQSNLATVGGGNVSIYAGSATHGFFDNIGSGGSIQMFTGYGLEESGSFFLAATSSSLIGNAGGFFMEAGNAIGNGNAGPFFMQAGSAQGFGTGGGFTFLAGTSLTGQAGGFTFQAGDNLLLGGSTLPINILGGVGSFSNGSDIVIISGATTGDSGIVPDGYSAGNVYITGNDAYIFGHGGNVILTPGSGIGGGDNGDIIFNLASTTGKKVITPFTAGQPGVDFTLVTSNGDSGFSAGNINLTAGDGYIQGGIINLYAGSSVDSGNGGYLILQGGDAVAGMSTMGGFLSLFGGQGDSAGNIQLHGGNSNGTNGGDGSIITVEGGQVGNAGSIHIQAAAGTSLITAGEVRIQNGDNGSTQFGELSISPYDFSSSIGGSIRIAAQPGKSTGDTTGGDVNILAGGGHGTGDGGFVTIQPGQPGSGTQGSITLEGHTGAIKIEVNETGIGFFAAGPIAKPTVTGSRGGNAALASLLTQLANLGLIIDSSS